MGSLRLLIIISIILAALISLPSRVVAQYITSDQAFNNGPAFVDFDDNIIVISGFQFSPPVINISPGTTVTWINQDSVSHTITSTDNLWDSGEIRPGMSFSATFISPGNFNYFCKFHPQMMGLVIAGSRVALTAAPVTATPFYNCPAIPTALPTPTYPTHLNYYGYY